MKSSNKMKAVMNLVKEVSAKGIAGDIVEAGVAWGGGVMPIIFYLACTGDLANRTVYLFDTWEGLPESADARDVGFKKGDFYAPWKLFVETKEWYGMFYGWRVTVHPAMQQTALPDWEAAFSHVKTVKGLFADTMPGALSGRQLALLMCDGDMYSSTRDCMSSAGNLVVRGGAIYNDDYFMFKGCYDAVREFRTSKASRPMRGSLFFNDGGYQEFPEGSLECVAPAMNGHEYQDTPEGSCGGRKVNGGILRVE